MEIKSRAPLRLGFAGGGTDVSPYCDIYGGCVLNATIDLWAECSIVPLDEPLVRVHSLDAGVFREVSMENPEKFESGAILIDGVIRKIVKAYGPLPGGFEISTGNDAPAGSGLGTSSTMVVTILKCFSEWLGLGLEKENLARLAFEIERVDLALSGGRQDQYAAAIGGVNFMEFLPGEKTVITPVSPLPGALERLERSMLLYYTGRSREGAAIIREQQHAAKSGNATAIGAMHRIKQSAYDMRDALEAGDLERFSSIIGSAWEDKKKMAGAISNPMIQKAFETAMEAGAISGKVSGAGGGGFMMLMVPPRKKAPVAKAMETLGGSIVPFSFTDKGAVSWKL